MPERLRLAATERPARPCGVVRGDGGRRHSQPVGGSEERRLLLQVPRFAGIGNRNGGRLRRMAAPAYSRGLGIPRSAGDNDGAAIHFALSREALQFWLPGVPKSRGPGSNLEIIEARRNRRATDGRLHDGPGGQRERAGFPSSRLHVFQRRRRTRRVAALSREIELKSGTALSQASHSPRTFRNPQVTGYILG